MNTVQNLLEGAISQAAQALGKTLTRDRSHVLGQGEADRPQAALRWVHTDMYGCAPIGAREGNNDAHLASAGRDLIDADDYDGSDASLLMSNNGLKASFPDIALSCGWDGIHYRSFKPSSSVPSQTLSSDR